MNPKSELKLVGGALAPLTMPRPGGGTAAIQTVGNRWTVSEAPADAPAGLVCIGLEARTDFEALRRAVSDC